MPCDTLSVFRLSCLSCLLITHMSSTVNPETRKDLIKMLEPVLTQIVNGTPLFFGGWSYLLDKHDLNEPNKYYKDPLRGKFYIEIETDPYPPFRCKPMLDIIEKIVTPCGISTGIIREYETIPLHSIEYTLHEVTIKNGHRTKWIFYCTFYMVSEFDNLIIDKILTS